MRTIGSPHQSTTNLGALLCLSLSMLLASLGTSITNIALPTLAQAFEAPFQQVQWVVVSYLATLTVFAVLAGRLGDIFGRQRMLLLGLVLFSLASAFCALAFSLWSLISARAVQGIGAAFLMTLTVALVRETTKDDRVGRAMGTLATMSAFGTALGPSLGGLLVGSFGWRSVFWALIPIGLLGIGLALGALPTRRGLAKSSPIRFSAVRDGSVLPSLVANLLVASVMMATLLVGPFYLGHALGLRSSVVGLLMSLGPVISICSGVPSGRLVDAWGAHFVLPIGLIMLIIGAFLLSVLPMFFGVFGYGAAIAILTPGYQLFQSANNTVVMAKVAEGQRGTVSGLLALSRNLGLLLGASVIGAVFAFGVGTAAIENAPPASIVHGMQLTFLVASALMLAAFWIMRRGRPKNQPPPG
ncbi:MAG: MFS transporter [Albidovulum sp.]